MNSLVVAVGISPGEPAEAQPQKPAAAAPIGAVHCAESAPDASKAALRGAETELPASCSARARRRGKGPRHLSNHGGEAGSITLPPLLIPVPQDLLHEADNLAQTREVLLPGGDPVHPQVPTLSKVVGL